MSEAPRESAGVVATACMKGEIERQTGQSFFGHSQIPLKGTISERDDKGSRREDYVKTNRVEISAPVPSRDRG